MRMLKKLLLMSIVLAFGTISSWAGQVIIAETQNGTVAVDNASPNAGDLVTITVTPNEGYQLDEISAELTLDPGNAQLPRRIEGPNVGIPVALTTETEGTTYTFEMPEAPYNVKVTATFAALPTYTITIANDIENGTVAADKYEATEGETVTLTVTPATGYELETLTYTVEGEDPVDIENNQFDMPGANVTITATFAAVDYTITVAET